MKGALPPPAPPSLYRTCSRCNRMMSANEWLNNVEGGEHFCNDCIVIVRMEAQRQGATPGWVPTAWIVCPHCGDTVNAHNDVCPHCRYRFELTSCPNCHRLIDKGTHHCECGWVNRAFVDTRVRTTKSMQKRISAKLYETVIFEIIGAFLILGLPFLGFPSMPFLAVAIMALLPLYNFLPNESELIASRQRNVESLGGEATGLLVLKSMSKLGMFFFSVAQFIILPVSKLIPLAISFFYYFTLPVSYKTTQPFKMLESWLRIVVGILIAVFIYWGFLGSSQAWSLALMSIAFFCTSFPRHRNIEESERGQVNVAVINGNGRGARFLRGDEGMFQDQFLSILFLIFMALSLYFSNIGLLGNLTGFVIPATFFIVFVTLLAGGTVNHAIVIIILMTVVGAAVWGIGSGDMIQIIFLAVWELSVITGLAGGKESRPAVGILMIVMTLFVFSFTATGVMGQAVFGFWWPQVVAFGDSIAEPIAPMWEQVQGSMSNAWLILTNPYEYYRRQTELTQVKQSVVKTGGTTKSIELGSFDLWPTTPGILEPTEPLLGYVEFENKGEFNANFLRVDLHATYKNVTDPIMVETDTGSIERVTCSGQPNPSSFDGCEWKNTIYPNEIKTASFKFSTSGWSPLDTPGPSPGTYQFGGYSIKIYADYTYDYSVNVSMPVEVIEPGLYEKKLMARDITLHSLESQYSGGPVKATLFTQKQPVRSDEYSLVRAAILNEGRGNITANSLKFTIYVPSILHPQAIDSSTFSGCPQGSSFIGPINTPGDPWNGFYYIDCNDDKLLGPNNYSIAIFQIKPLIDVDIRTTLIVGVASYSYVKSGSSTLTLTTVARA